MPRWIEFERGPYDGRRAEVLWHVHELAIPMRGPFSMAVAKLPPQTKARIGIYKEDPLDPYTFLWMGET